jgi:cytochrome c biogenesis protein
MQDGQLYAFKGLAGRLGPIGVHVALLMCLFGTAYRCVNKARSNRVPYL